MNKHHQNIIAIFFIVIISLFLFAYWFDMSFGYGQMSLILAGGYGIYLNFKAIKEEQKPT
ncbi:hypothetical protein [Lentibacillus amyloliquefaciens]|uniref:Uncharacterized protein n=1 Tax=Lentibacillus amyloliquefaciens TaxID=1472767 RepID=A0A0U3W2V7_9BACI|nr:hypothetical protein [Lentibacillus amyloliquefaciens]ALX47506.1 hypothetical protein AOX59_02145 [Lentibacillus amyloliquefaciens]